MTKFLQSTWMTAISGAITFFITLVLLWEKIEPPPARETNKKNERTTSGFTLASNDEIDGLIADLQQRQRELNTREQQLNDFEARIKSQAAELYSITQEVARLQTSFDNVVIQIKEDETANLKRLAKTYAAMTPESASDILRLLDDNGVVKILSFMKEEEMAKTLEALARPGDAEKKRVGQLSQKLRLVTQRTTATPAPPNP